MMYLFFALIFIAYLYFGYKDDFKRNGANFKMTVFGVFGMVLLGISIFYIKTELDVHVKHAISSYYEDKFEVSKKVTAKELADEIFSRKIPPPNKKVNLAMSIYDIFYFIFAYFIINQFDKFIKKRYTSNSLKNAIES
jgi:amino acid transporter